MSLAGLLAIEKRRPGGTDYPAGGLDAHAGNAAALFSDNIAFVLRKQ